MTENRLAFAGIALQTTLHFTVSILRYDQNDCYVRGEQLLAFPFELSSEKH